MSLSLKMKFHSCYLNWWISNTFSKCWNKFNKINKQKSSAICSLKLPPIFVVHCSNINSFSNQVSVLCLSRENKLWSSFQSHRDVTPCFNIQIALTFKWSDTLCFECELPLEGNFHLKHSSSSFCPLFIGFDTHWGTLRCYFSSALMLRLRGVVSVVSQFSKVSKVNTLSNTQVCKCFHYNTGFFLFTLTEHACCLRAECGLTALSPPGAQTPPFWSRASEGDDNTKVLHTGGWVCILWVSEQRPRQQRHVIQTLLPSHPLLSLHFLWYQQTEKWNTGEFLWTANIYCFPPFHHLSEGPKTLVKKWCIRAFVYTFWWVRPNYQRWKKYSDYLLKQNRSVTQEPSPTFKISLKLKYLKQNVLKVPKVLINYYWCINGLVVL